MQAYSAPRGKSGVSRNATPNILIACSVICTEADFHTLLTAEKYPDNAEETEIAGRENDIIRKGFMARKSSNHKIAIGFDNVKRRSAAVVPNEREYKMHFFIADLISD
jgi:hypothetical protein